MNDLGRINTNTQYTVYGNNIDEATTNTKNTVNTVSYGTYQDDGIFSSTGQTATFGGPPMPTLSMPDFLALLSELQQKTDENSGKLEKENILTQKAEIKKRTENNVKKYEEHLDKLSEAKQEKKCALAMVIVGPIIAVVAAPFTFGTSVALMAPVYGVGADKFVKANKEIDEHKKHNPDDAIKSHFKSDAGLMLDFLNSQMGLEEALAKVEELMFLEVITEDEHGFIESRIHRDGGVGENLKEQLASYVYESNRIIDQDMVDEMNFNFINQNSNE